MNDRETAELERPTKNDIWLASPDSIDVDWSKNLSRCGVEPTPENDPELIGLALSMLPPDKGSGESGQRNPVICMRPKGGRPTLTGGYRRFAAARWLVKSGTCPDFKVKYVISRMTATESALANLIENVQRKELTKLQIAHAARTLIEGYGLPISEVAKRVHISEVYLGSLLDVVALPEPVQHAVANGTTTMTAAIELTKAPAEDQAEIHQELAAEGGKVTVERIKRHRRTKEEMLETLDGKARTKGAPIKRTSRELAAWIETKSGPLEPGYRLACHLCDYLDGKLSDSQMSTKWDKSFPKPDSQTPF